MNRYSPRDQAKTRLGRLLRRVEVPEVGLITERSTRPSETRELVVGEVLRVSRKGDRSGVGGFCCSR